jgi:hypothetical protein
LPKAPINAHAAAKAIRTVAIRNTGLRILSVSLPFKLT